MMKKILFVNLLCYAIAACLIAQPTLPDYGKHAFKQQALNDFVNIHSDLLMSVMPPCNPPFMVMGLYDPDVPLAPNPAIFADPMVKPEIMSDWFQGKDKEYGDIDNDGLIDILYTKNDNELWYIPNTGSLTVPDYQAANAVQTLFTNVFSFRLVDFFNDGVLDLLLLEDHGTGQINLYNDIHGQLGAPASIGLIDDTTFPLRFDQLIEAGDVDGDGDVDVLISGQDPGLRGTAFLEQLQAPPFSFPYLQLGAGQTLPQSPMIPDNQGSYHSPEMYDADCDGDLDLFISDPLLLTAGGHVDYYENTGAGSPFIYFTQQSVIPYGLVDIPGDFLRCDWVIMRFVDFFGDGCPEVISYNPCNMTNNPKGEIFYYKNSCSCDADFTFASLDSCQFFQFNDNSSGPGTLTYSWNFGDPASGANNNTSTLQNPIHQFSGCGNFNVSLTINGLECNATIYQTIQVIDNIPPTITGPNNLYLTTQSSNCSMVVNGLHWHTLTDDCSDPSVKYTVTGASSHVGVGDASGLIFNQGVSIVTYTATDHCGNTAIWSFAVIIDCICVCQDNLVNNGGFNQGAVAGTLGLNGSSNFWMKTTGTPEIVGGDYCCEDYAMHLQGNQNGGESVCQAGINLVSPFKLYEVSFCARYDTNSVAPYVIFGFTASNDCITDPFNCTSCEQIGTSPQISSFSWSTYTIPIWAPSQNWMNINIRAFNNTNDLSAGLIDNICIKEVFNRCCEDESVFMENVENNIEILISDELHEVEFVIGDIGNCNIVEYIDWGDGNIETGQFTEGTTLNHIYGDSNEYQIDYLVIESSDLIPPAGVCFENVFSESVCFSPTCAGCSCDLIDLGVLRKYDYANSDTCCYVFYIENDVNSCFRIIDLKLSGTAYFTSWTNLVLPTSWSIIQINAQHLQIIRPTFYLPNGFYTLDFCVTGEDNHHISASTSWSDGINTHTCLSDFSYECPASNISNCCPVGTVQGPNLIFDGNFAQTGPLGIFASFHSQLLVTSSPTLSNSRFWIGTNPSFINSSFTPCGDHTTGSSNMLVVNGATTPSLNVVWGTTSGYPLSVLPNTNYSFEYWVTPVSSTLPPIMQTEINGVILGTIAIPSGVCSWNRICYTWFSGNNTTAILLVRNLNYSNSGNDFALDDFTFRSCTPAPCQASFTFSPLHSCGNFQFTSTSTNLPTNAQYCWDIDIDPITCESTLPNPTFQFASCTSYYVCLTVSGDTCNSTSCQTVIYTDTIAPIAICSDIILELDANCEAIVTPGLIDGGSTDNCQIQSMTVSPNILTGCGLFPVTLTVTDKCGNTSTCTTIVQTAESIPPTLTCPPSITLNTHWPNCSELVNGIQWVSANDNCGVQSITYNVSGASSYFGPNDASGLVYNPGVSTVTYTASDECGNQTTCAFDVSISCDSLCVCGSYSSMFIRTGGAPSQPVVCGGPPITLGCPPPGGGYNFSGLFNCLGGICPAINDLNWMLSGPGISQSGNTGASPFFGFTLSSAFFVQPGLYTLTLNVNCGTNSCPCIIQFYVDCPDPCPCDPIAFANSINRGVLSYTNFTTCNTCIRPNALNDCDMVEWSIDGAPVSAMTIGNQVYCVTLPSGSHFATATVTRKRLDGTICATAVIPYKFRVSCQGQRPFCGGNIIFNPGFDAGAVAGGFHSGGASEGWTSLFQELEVVEGLSGGDGWTIQLKGNLDTSGILTTRDPICLTSDTGFIDIRFSVRNSRPCEVKTVWIWKRSYQPDSDDPSDWDPDSSLQVANILLGDLDIGVWYDVSIPYDSRNWFPTDSCDAGIMIRPAILVSNIFSSVQGGEDTYTYVQVDNFCMEGMIVAVNDPTPSSGIRIYPNPTTGMLNIEMPIIGHSDISLQVMSLTGQQVLNQRVEPGIKVQTIDASSLHQGMYFLQIVSKGQVMAVNKFVKQ